MGCCVRTQHAPTQRWLISKTPNLRPWLLTELTNQITYCRTMPQSHQVLKLQIGPPQNIAGSQSSLTAPCMDFDWCILVHHKLEQVDDGASTTSNTCAVSRRKAWRLLIAVPYAHSGDSQ